MRAGKLDRRITLQTRTAVQSVSGEYTETFANLATVWAEVTDLRGREFFAAQQKNADVTTRFRIRWRDDVTVLHRIQYESRNYNIVHSAEIGRREGLELLAESSRP